MDAAEVIQDVPSYMNFQSLSHSSYRSWHMSFSKWGPGIFFRVEPCTVDHCGGVEPASSRSYMNIALLPPGLSLNIPPFLSIETYFMKEEAKLCYKIGKTRIHVERANEKIENYCMIHCTSSVHTYVNKNMSVMLLMYIIN